MKKTIGRLIFLLASVFVLGIYLKYDEILLRFRNDVMAVQVLSSEEIDMKCQGKEDAFMEPEIQLNGGRIAYDTEQNMLLIPQELEEAAFDGKLEVPDGELFFLEDEGLQNKGTSIAENRVFRLFWVREAQCWMYNVYFTGMPVACITAEVSGTQSGEDITDDTKTAELVYTGEVWVYDQYHSAARYQQAECNYHLRGATTLNYEKSSYRLTLENEKLSFLGMRKDDDWILSSLYDDEGLIHNKLSYDVWQEIAASNSVSYDEGISMEYVELFINNKYLGIYGLSERIDKKELSLNKGDILYKCRDQRLPEESEYYTELTPEMNPVFTIQYPKEFSMEAWEPLKSWVNLFGYEQLKDYETGKQMLNMENAIDYNIFNQLIYGMDNIMKNIYFNARYQSDGSYKFIKIPWDLNMTWGNSWVDDINCNFNIYKEKNISDTGGWSTDMAVLYYYNEQEVSQLLWERWKELRENIITVENITTMLNREFNYLHSSGAYIRNYQKWQPKGDYWQEHYIYEYVEGRIAFLDTYYEKLYRDSVSETVYNGVDYSEEFETRYYYEYNYEEVSENCNYDKEQLLEHYVLYGKPAGLIARKE